MELLIIGFDGADYELMEQLIEQGELPNLSKIADKGTFSQLNSTSIPITPCAWTSFMTGKNPGKHGIFDFTRVTRDGLEVVSFNDVKEKTIFEILSDQYKSGTLNIPATYPPIDINGFMVSGMMTPNIEKSTKDPETKEILKEENYIIEVPETNTGRNKDKLIESCYKTLEARKNTAKRLIEEKTEMDIFMPVFTVGDRISHWFWKYHDPEHPEFEETEYKNEVKKIYKEIDQAIGEIIEKAGGLDQNNVVVMSDHGFTGLYRGLNLNKALIDQDLLKIKKNPLSQLRYLLYRSGFTLENVYNLVSKIGLESFVKSTADNPERDWLRKLLSLPFLSFKDVDFENSKAYSALHFGPIFLLEEDARKQVNQLLEDLEYNGEKIVENIENGEELFHGPFEEQAPDIVYHTKGMHYQAHRYFEFGSNKLFSQPSSKDNGHHRLEGIFLAAGPDFQQKEEEDLEEAEITDIAPTLLASLGRKIPGDMDGKPLPITKKQPEYDESAISDF